MAKVSVLIPARNEPHLHRTVSDLLSKARGDLEVIVILDGYWPDPPLMVEPRLVTIHHAESRGMRIALNEAASIATGDYLMKTDAHCMFAEGFDVDLAAHCEDTWLCVPSRWSLNVEAWTRNFGPIEYNYVTFPYEPDAQFGDGLHGKKWLGPDGRGSLRPHDYYYLERLRADLKIDDIQTWQGSCWFMAKAWFAHIGPMDCRFSNIHQEAQELGFKTWLGGGRLVINKHTWYAHWHKNENRRGYRLSKQAMRETQRYSTWYWMNDQWPLQTRTMRWFVEHFWPIPGWPEDWEARKIAFEAEHPPGYAHA